MVANMLGEARIAPSFSLLRQIDQGIRGYGKHSSIAKLSATEEAQRSTYH
jgi:hypothetical protein